MIAEAMMVLTSIVLAILAVDVVSALPVRGAWWPFAVWGSLGAITPSIAVTWRADVPLPVAALLLVLTIMMWSFRSRLRWSAEHGHVW
jgi:uncharacterized membrane protein